jgi:hypothetical protein
MHDVTLLKRQSIEEMNHIEDGRSFGKRSLVFDNEYAVKTDANAIVKNFNDRLAMGKPGWNGIPVRLVDEFGELVNAQLRTHANRRGHRRAWASAKLADNSLIWLLISDATSRFGTTHCETPLGCPPLDPMFKQIDSSGERPDYLVLRSAIPGQGRQSHGQRYYLATATARVRGHQCGKLTRLCQLWRPASESACGSSRP